MAAPATIIWAECCIGGFLLNWAFGVSHSFSISDKNTGERETANADKREKLMLEKTLLRQLLTFNVSEQGRLEGGGGVGSC